MSDTAIGLLREALHIRMNGEYAPGGGENWFDWEGRAIDFLMGEDGKAGDSEPRGDSPDSPAAGKAGLPGGSDDYLSAGATSYDPRTGWTLTPDGSEYIRRTGLVPEKSEA